jgi:hypothetical protein
VLRGRTPKRPHLNNTDRFLFVWLYRWFPSVLEVVAIVRPETIIRWHRAGFRAYWRWRSRNRVGRPKVSAELRTLIGEMSRANALWGAPRIHGELLKLGFEVAQSTVARYMCRHSRPPSQAWRPGYKDWRSGDIAATWRRLGTQIASGKPGLPRGMIPLPVESILTGPFPYDFKCTDIPLRFVGTGLIADRLLDRAATLNVPARSELERALRYYKHVPDISGGKGSHEKWTGPDKHAFILPKRDPVSIGVFKSFLRHVGIDKSTYLASVRPNL